MQASRAKQIGPSTPKLMRCHFCPVNIAHDVCLLREEVQLISLADFDCRIEIFVDPARAAVATSRVLQF